MASVSVAAALVAFEAMRVVVDVEADGGDLETEVVAYLVEVAAEVGIQSEASKSVYCLAS